MVRFQEEAWQELLMQRYNFYSKIPIFRMKISIMNVNFNFFIVNFRHKIEISYILALISYKKQAAGIVLSK